MTHASDGYETSRPGVRLPCGVVVPTFEEMRAGRTEGSAVSYSLRFITCPGCREYAKEHRWPEDPAKPQMELSW